MVSSLVIQKNLKGIDFIVLTTIQRKSVISNDYVVYLQESEFDLGIDNDPVCFSQAISNDNSNK